MQLRAPAPGGDSAARRRPARFEMKVCGTSRTQRCTYALANEDGPTSGVWVQRAEITLTLPLTRCLSMHVPAAASRAGALAGMIISRPLSHQQYSGRKCLTSRYLNMSAPVFWSVHMLQDSISRAYPANLRTPSLRTRSPVHFFISRSFVIIEKSKIYKGYGYPGGPRISSRVLPRVAWQ